MLQTWREQVKEIDNQIDKAIPVFFRLASNEFLMLGRTFELKKKKLKTLGYRRPGTSASLLWSLETTRHEPKINIK